MYKADLCGLLKALITEKLNNSETFTRLIIRMKKYADLNDVALDVNRRHCMAYFDDLHWQDRDHIIRNFDYSSLEQSIREKVEIALAYVIQENWDASESPRNVLSTIVRIFGINGAAPRIRLAN